jgi:hypothetical protein
MWQTQCCRYWRTEIRFDVANNKVVRGSQFSSMDCQSPRLHPEKEVHIPSVRRAERDFKARRWISRSISRHPSWLYMNVPVPSTIAAGFINTDVRQEIDVLETHISNLRSSLTTLSYREHFCTHHPQLFQWRIYDSIFSHRPTTLLKLHRLRNWTKRNRNAETMSSKRTALYIHWHICAGLLHSH